ncbi:hypothetical protein VRRI112168_07140 [Vreelandella rituensis]|uniref:Uncharacterized protein n=1 Tax=Vreelandella rituensis TaxID=2282306 RepID=A0A368UAF1_9GAMM|nr:hypothetical protein [Halomonas rituensis]RCV92153.1 hypothetical protein DU506_09110 [Halomonas rituensis]
MNIHETIVQLSTSDGGISVHQYLPIDPKKPLLVVYQDIHGSGVTSAILEKGRFLSMTNRAIVRGVKTWRYMQD